MVNRLDQNESIEHVTSRVVRERVLSSLVGRHVLVSGAAWRGPEPDYAVTRFDGDQIRIAWPEGAGDPPPQGISVDVNCTLPDARYRFAANLAGVDGNEVQLRVGPELLRVQYRQDFRVPVPDDHHVYLVPDEEIGAPNPVAPGEEAPPAGADVTGEEVEGPPTGYRLMDLSLGGARLRWRADRDLPQVGDRIVGELQSEFSSPLPVEAEVRRVDVGEGDEETRVSLAFRPMPPWPRQRLQSLCFDLQRAMMHSR